MSDPVVCVESFSLVRDGRTLVHGDRWAVEPGQRVLLTGPSGSGKSSFLLALAGLADDHAPGLGLEGSVVRPERVGVLFQNPYAQLVCPTVDDEVAFALENAGWDQGAMVRRVAELKAVLGLESLGDREPWTFSGGEAQRVALAAVLAPRPGVVLLDEPLGFLDGPSAQTLVQLATQADRSAAWVVVDHNPEPWARWADVHYHLTDGQWVKAPVVVPTRTSTPPAPPVPGGVGLTIDGLTVGYAKGHPVLEGFDLAVAAGETVALVGPSGAGKSTVFRCLTGQLKPWAGTIEVAGVPYRPRLRRPAPLAWVPQVPEHYFVHPTVAQEWASDDAGRAFGLTALATRHPLTLSEGEKRRLNLASALGSDRPIVLLDEPQFGLDEPSLAALEAGLRLLQGQGKTVLIISHDPSFCRRNAHRVVEVGR